MGRYGALTLGLVVAFACGDKVTVNETAKGGLAESCRSRNDCMEGLMCIDMVCTNGPGTPSTQDAATGNNDAGVVRTRSELGESCQTRADCMPPLACIDNTCLEGFPMDASVEIAASRGRRGESCEATNDCERGLACIGARCLESDFDLEYIPKQCYRVQCAAAEDCCEDFRPASGYSVEQCETMRTNCLNAGVYPPPSTVPPAITANDCIYYSRYCLCMMDCVEEQCVPITEAHCLVDGQCTIGAGTCVNNRCAACAVDADCVNSLLPYCVSSTCSQCKQDSDCPSAGSRCVAGSCQLGCSNNEHCALLEECQDGECTYVGCHTDRQCYFVTGDDRSRCVDTKCQTPCENDAECLDPFHICSDGVCVFAGCDDDEDCRAVLNLAGQSAASLDRAVCREPDE